MPLSQGSVVRRGPGRVRLVEPPKSTRRHQEGDRDATKKPKIASDEVTEHEAANQRSNQPDDEVADQPIASPRMTRPARSPAMRPTTIQAISPPGSKLICAKVAMRLLQYQ